MTPNEQHQAEAARDYLSEAGRISRGTTLMIPESAHFDAVVQLVREAYELLDGAPDSEVSLVDWLAEADKVLGRASEEGTGASPHAPSGTDREAPARGL